MKYGLKNLRVYKMLREDKIVKLKRMIFCIIGIACIAILGVMAFDNNTSHKKFVKKEKSIPREKKTRTIITASWGDSYGSIDEMTGESDFIALVTVDGIEKTYVEEEIPFTIYNVSVDVPVYQAKKEQKILIVMTGQETDNSIVEIASDPLMEAGDRMLVFCKKNEDGSYRISGGPQGRFIYKDGKVTSVRLRNVISNNDAI